VVVRQAQEQGDEGPELGLDQRTQHGDDQSQHPEESQLLPEGDDHANIHLRQTLV
jgi:hypothetical protein